MIIEIQYLQKSLHRRRIKYKQKKRIPTALFAFNCFIILSDQGRLHFYYYHFFFFGTYRDDRGVKDAAAEAQ